MKIDLTHHVPPEQRTTEQGGQNAPHHHDLLIRPALSMSGRVSDTDYDIENAHRIDYIGAMAVQRNRRGIGFFEKDGLRYRVEPGQAMLFTHGEQSRYGYDVDSFGPMDFEFVSFYGDTIRPVFNDLVQRYGPVIDMPTDSESNILLQSFVQKYKENAFASRYEASAHIYQMLMAILQSCSQEEHSKDPIKAAWEWIHFKYTKPFNLKTLADELGISRAYLSRQFKTIYGCSPSAMLRELRMKHSKHLLGSTNITIEEISNLCGFGNPEAFSRAYKKMFGLFPSEYRKTLF